MTERILWTMAALLSLGAALFFLIVQHDATFSGAISLITLSLLQFRAQATS